MCDYCGCRELPAIGELSADHEAIRGLVDELRRRPAGADAAPSRLLARLQEALGPHLRREEIGIFAQLERRNEASSSLARLRDEHARARAGLLARDPAGPGWSSGIDEELDELVAHIELEEYDLFPALPVLLDDGAWAAVRSALAGDAGGTDPRAGVGNRKAG